MKCLLLILIYKFSVFAFTHEARVMVRHSKKAKLFIVKKKLQDLISSRSFEGKYFKIVQGTSSDAISFDHESKALLLRAATVYYHLTVARNFWISELSSSKVMSAPQIVVRVNIDREFSDLGHFAHEEHDKVYNNALSIPSGFAPEYIQELNAQRGLAPIVSWGDEIWFRPKKKVLAKNLPDHHLGENPLTTQLRDLQGPVGSYADGRVKNELMQYLFWEGYQGPFWQALAWSFGSMAVLKVVTEGSKLMDPLFLEKWFYLDTALVPEVIYHEYNHIALSDYLEMSHSTASIEGIADYFAARIANRYKLYEKAKNVSSVASKNAKRKKNRYLIDFEKKSFAHGDLVYGILWSIYEKFPQLADRLIYNSRKFYSTKESLIYSDFLRAILQSCQEVCSNPLKDRHSLLMIFSQRGF